jgi:predicted O-linked N-acetylglucosamine transferase (SPINDLY family)
LTVELFELCDKKQFELIAFYSGVPDSSNIQNRISSAFDKFINTRLKNDQEIAELSRVMGIDIAVDLTGSTANERVGIFAYRAAPIQISYIGYLGTIGAEYYDYLIADKTIIPVKNQDYYAEKIVYLPSYQVNDSKRLISDKVFKKIELNLPVNGFVFCCFNNSYKIVPSTFEGWMKILNAVPDSILFLYASNKRAEVNLKIEAEKRGVSQNRIIFCNWIERSEYLARFKVADLFLDTLPYNAGTTASDALWAGLPVLTCMGESFASRVAASLLNAIELPELITTTQAEYEAKAIELGNNPAKLKAIKDKLERNRLTTALFDTPRFTKHIEAAYIKMYERYQADLPPDHIYIDAQ